MKKKFNFLGLAIVICCFAVLAFGANRCGKEQAKQRIQKEMIKSIHP